MSAFVALLGRDIRLAFRAGGGAMLALAFFIVMAALIPLGIGPDLKLLAKVAGGVVWSAALLAALLSLDRLFQADYEDGSLDLIALSPLPLEAASFAKIAAHWLTTGLPLTVVSPLLGLLYGLPPAAYPALVLSLLIGTPAISAIGAVGASLTLPVRRGGLILPLLVLPLVTPALIFGAGAISAALNGLSNGAFGLLCAFSFVAVIVSPFITAFAVRPNLAG
ncbi:MAG: heme exporter protein CcmB [Alphaproteobacteria bacterium]|jgi:heme exporter protein B|nr:heme exporter protein CcmB [Alphaproteobacteria bacterium]OJU56521.1 MAG: heme exporter protein CcmB [Alphaproteobacteria bacterium 62-8]MBN9558712.1 heme exporter protein CcmB [Alphaproteobacteria bacterium]MBN9566072.1 heme exporter protein CcmB [Alphaproteobacteria bacterium]MBN9571544.1 heme exporter protein CcmB [Alphaproteobacteria bacterium]